MDPNMYNIPSSGCCPAMVILPPRYILHPIPTIVTQVRLLHLASAAVEEAGELASVPATAS